MPPQRADAYLELGRHRIDESSFEGSGRGEMDSWRGRELGAEGRGHGHAHARIVRVSSAPHMRESKPREGRVTTRTSRSGR